MIDFGQIFFHIETAKRRAEREAQHAKEETAKLLSMTPEEQVSYFAAKAKVRAEELRLREVQALERIAHALERPSEPREITLKHRLF